MKETKTKSEIHAFSLLLGFNRCLGPQHFRRILFDYCYVFVCVRVRARKHIWCNQSKISNSFIIGWNEIKEIKQKQQRQKSKQ